MKSNEAAVLESWNRGVAPAYHVREADLHWNLRRQDWVKYETIADGRALVATATPLGIQQGMAAKSIWLALWNPDVASNDLIEILQRAAHERERSKITVGGDEFHFLPGVPDPDGAGLPLKEALQQRGFNGDLDVDYLGSLASEAVERYIAQAIVLADEHGWRLRVANSASDLAAIGAFLQREFPGRWAREFAFWQQRTDTRRAFWARFDLKNGEIGGFARMAVRGASVSDWTPGALRLPLGASVNENDSCLGPIGVAASLRGQGAGKALLGLVLDQLRGRNAGRVCIDWTNAFKYYEPLSFVNSRQYWCAWKNASV